MRGNDGDKPLHAVSSHHAASRGRSPAINGDRPNCCRGYFGNTFGEQFIFVYDMDIGKAELQCGDAEWVKPFAVMNGLPNELILTA